MKKSLTKKWVSPNIAPLQPPTLATFRFWGGSAGAGRIELTRGKDRLLLFKKICGQKSLFRSS